MNKYIIKKKQRMISQYINYRIDKINLPIRRWGTNVEFCDHFFDSSFHAVVEVNLPNTTGVIHQNHHVSGRVIARCKIVIIVRIFLNSHTVDFISSCHGKSILQQWCLMLYSDEGIAYQILNDVQFKYNTCWKVNQWIKDRNLYTYTISPFLTCYRSRISLVHQHIPLCQWYTDLFLVYDFSTYI